MWKLRERYIIVLQIKERSFRMFHEHSNNKRISEIK